MAGGGRHALPSLAFLFLAIVGFVHVSSAADVFASASNINKLFSLEKFLATFIRDFYSKKMESLQNLLQLAEELERAETPASEIAQTPADSYRVIDRLIRMVDAVHAHISPSDTLLERFLNTKTSLLPDRSDLSGAASSILRLQRTYNLTVNDLFSGGTSTQYVTIGKEAYKQSDYLSAVDWFYAALNANTSSSEEYIETMDFLGYSLFKMGDIEGALKLSQQLLRYQPENSRVADNIEYYSYLLSGRIAAHPTNDDHQHNFTEDNKLLHSDEEMAAFRKLCQGEIFYIPPEPLFCEYVTYGNPALLLKPAKIEHLTLGFENLRILRDFASDEECEVLRQVAAERLERSVAYTGDGFSPVTFRVSTVAWLDDSVAEIVHRFNQRISQWTNLDVGKSEQLQVSNYGIGGHYEPHYDFFGDKKNDENGDRLATFMAYLSDVAQGGATAFPRLGTRAFPVKGDAAFWINLNGEDASGNAMTLHGACPVLLGSKWVANKWIHEENNEGFLAGALDMYDSYF